MFVRIKLCLLMGLVLWWTPSSATASTTTPTMVLVPQLPDTSGIDGQLTANLEVDHFFSLWLVFNNDEVKMSAEPFTILAPRNSAGTREDSVLKQPELVKKLLLDHILLGERLDLTNTTTFKTLGGKQIKVHKTNDKLYVNDAQVLQTKIEVPNGILIILDSYLFPDDKILKKNVMIGGDQGKLDVGMLSVVTVKDEVRTSSTTAPAAGKHSTFIDNVSQVLSYLKSGVRVFQHFLSRSNVSQLLKEGEEYTVFVPTDHAFQRWHPIDWGFYPFSVPEFTENVMINHFIRGNLRQENIRDGQIAKTLGGREVVFRKSSTLTINGATIVKGDTAVEKGNIMFIGEVLFVSESIVSRLHQQHRDKETPPLLAFPWFGAQFLSHAFLALERDRRFTHITRFLNLADLAPHVSGTGYTFFVPTDTAFEKLGLDKMPDNYLSTGDGLQILLNHFLKGRLYDRDLKDGITFGSLGNKTITVSRNTNVVRINDANIVESEVFVYNLGTMFYIDKVLFATAESLPAAKLPVPSTTEQIISTMETEMVPDELTEDNGNLPDVLFANSEAPTTNGAQTTVTNSSVTIK
ncbi:uncharacterized protein CBL_02900 [Carabus blaptoides fortunei]